MPDSAVKQYLTEVYTLFPEYQDESRKASAPYVTQLANGFGEESCPECFVNILNIWKFYSFDSFCKYYDSRNLSGMLYPYDTLDFPNVKKMVMAKISQCGVMDWRKEFEKSTGEMRWRDLDLAQDVCAHVYERSQVDNECLKVNATILALDDTVIADGDNSICVTISYQQCSLRIQKSLSDLHIWLTENRIPQRRFKYCDKHGEYGKGGWYLPDGKHTALLDCSREHAQTILHKAIGDISMDKDLWYYDDANGCFIYFENQGDTPQHEYHAYHLKPGDKNYDKIVMEKLRKVQPHI